MRCMVIAAHPDDEVLGCGGTIARLAKEGHEIVALILGEGITSRYPQRADANRTSLKKLKKSIQQVAVHMGIQEVISHELPDNRFDTLPLLDIVKLIEKSIQRICPETIYTHHGGDLNVDHSIVNRAVLTATRPVSGQSVKALYAFETPSCTEWAFSQLRPDFRPNFFVDISDTLTIKLQAMKLYESEMRPFPHPRSSEALEALAMRWGATVGLQAAEAFELIRSIG